MNSNIPETGKLYQTSLYNPDTLEPSTILVDTSKLECGIMIDYCFGESRIQVGFNHPYFLHNHPKMEKDYNIDRNHVIVDIED